MNGANVARRTSTKRSTGCCGTVRRSRRSTTGATASEAIEREVQPLPAHRYKRELSLILFDIDHFKSINDAHGHLAGDAVLRQVAAEVKPRLREQDLFARVGGEEFAISCRRSRHEGAMATGEKVRRIVEAASFLVETLPVKVTVSVGVTSLDARGREPTSLYERADAALYQAKGKGGTASRRREARRCARGYCGQLPHSVTVAPCEIHARTRSSSSNVRGSVLESSFPALTGVCTFGGRLSG